MVPAIIVVVAFVAYNGRCIHIDMANVQENVNTETTTVLATLITIICSFVALLVTVYIFLIGTLAGAKNYERRNVAEYKRTTTRRVFTTVVISFVVVAADLILDNIDKKVVGASQGLIFVGYMLAAASFLDILALALFTSDIVRYDRNLRKYAEKYIKNVETAFKSNHEHEDNESEKLIKKIGDLEVIVNDILKNHEADFRYGSSSDVGQLYQELTHKGIGGKTAKAFCDDYESMIEVRNRLWIIQTYGDHFPTTGLGFQVDEMLHQATMYLMSGERFRKENFVGSDFVDADFTGTSFRESAFTDVKFCKAKLVDSDFTETLIQNVDFKDADCTDIVLRGAKLTNISISEKTVFTRAVLDDAVITFKRDILYEQDPEKMYRFDSISGHRLNLINSRLISMDFSNSVLAESQFSAGMISDCKFDYCNLKKAFFANVDVSTGSSFKYADMEGMVAPFSAWGKSVSKKDGKPVKLNSHEARLAGSNLTNSQISNCDFSGAYINDASFGETRIEKCCFDDSFLDHSDFANIYLCDSSFINASMNGAMITGYRDKGKEEDYKLQDIKNVHFDDAKLTNAEIRNRTFVHCTFNNTIFNGSILHDVTFKDCSFHNAQFADTLFMKVHWKKCHNLDSGRWINPSGGRIAEFASDEDKERFERAAEHDK